MGEQNEQAWGKALVWGQVCVIWTVALYTYHAFRRISTHFPIYISSSNIYLLSLLAWWTNSQVKAWAAFLLPMLATEVVMAFSLVLLPFERSQGKSWCLR